MNFVFTRCALGIALLIAAPAIAWAEAVTLKFGFPAPPTSYVNTDAITPWINDVEKASDGTLKIQLYVSSYVIRWNNFRIFKCFLP